MKFLTKINRQYLRVLAILLIIICAVGYFVLRAILNNKLKEDIFEKQYAIAKEIKTQNNLPNIYPIIETKKIRKDQAEPKSYKETFLSDDAEDETEPYLEYTNTLKINNQYYLIKLRHSLVETDDLVVAIAIPLLLLLILTFLFSFLLTKSYNKTVWNDFENNLEQIESFSFENGKILSLKKSDIEEFNRLNTILGGLLRRLTKDYSNLKEFTENASHELQTPLAIISINFEEILQKELQPEILNKVYKSYQMVKRLSNLNKNLLLLTKIENRQFEINETIVFNEIVKEKFLEFSSLVKDKNIKVNIVSQDNLKMKISKDLGDILINNLFSNAIKHNTENGYIDIEIKKNSFKICNSGNQTNLTNDNIFNRFTKKGSNSFGLGLAIVKNICDTHKLEITYFQKNNSHCFLITSNLKANI